MRRPQRHQAGGQVDEEDPAPARASRDHAAEEDPGRRPHPCHRPPGPERLVALGPGAERGRQDRQRGGNHHRGAGSLNEAGADQHAFAGGDPADQGGDPEERGPAHQDAAASEEIRHPAAEQHEPAVGEQVRAEHPLQALHGEPQVPADRRKRDVDDRRVDEVQEGDRAQQRQDELSLASGEDGRLGRG